MCTKMMIACKENDEIFLYGFYVLNLIIIDITHFISIIANKENIFGLKIIIF